MSSFAIVDPQIMRISLSFLFRFLSKTSFIVDLRLALDATVEGFYYTALLPYLIYRTRPS